MVTVEYSENGGVNDCKEYFADYDVIEMTHLYDSFYVNHIVMSHVSKTYLYESLFFSPLTFRSALM